MLGEVLRKLDRILLLALLVMNGNLLCAADDLWNDTIRDAVKDFAQQLKGYMTTDRRPCHDFFGRVCAKKNMSPAFDVQQSEESIFKRFVENEDEETLMDVELKLKRFYESCRNARGIEQLKSSHLYRITGGWPAIESQSTTGRDPPSWMNILASFHDIGVYYFFQNRVEIRNNKRYVIFKANVNLKYSLNKNTQRAIDLLQNFGIESNEARLIALDFTGLEGYRREVARAPTGSSSNMTYSEFKIKFANIDWDMYFRRALGKPLKDTDDIHLEDEQKLDRIFSMLAKTTGTRLLNYVWIDYLLEKGSADCSNLVRQYFGPVYRYIIQRSSTDKRRIVKLFSDIGSVYQSLLPTSVWIDEISNEKSRLYLGKLIHVALNGDAKLDAHYASLTMTRKNFYRNLEKCHRFSDEGGDKRRIVSSTSASLSDLYDFFTDPLYKEILPQPLLYGSIGVAFAERMIEDGGSGVTPGSWRSTYSDEKFAEHEACLLQQNINYTSSAVIGNNLIRKLLAESVAFEALQNWITDNVSLAKQVSDTLKSIDSEFSLEKVFFYTLISSQCKEKLDFINLYMKNTKDFAEVFGCIRGSTLNPSRVCLVLSERI